MLDERVMQIADDAVAGEAPSRSDIVYLLRFDAYSAEAAYVCARARELGMRACGGRGYVFAQIGVDSTACPENCRFCSFAAVNVDTTTYDPAQVEVPLERIVHYAKLFDGAGVDLISLMATAGLRFDRYLDIMRAVRASVSDDMRLMANTADLSFEQARALADAGATTAYHALRLGEGVITDISPDDRRCTMRNLRDAGVELMTGVEPVWHDIDPVELSSRICDLPGYDPFAVGSCSYTAVESADMGGREPALTGFVRYVGALTRLVCGKAVPIGGIGGVSWVDAGCDPRNRGYGEDDDTLRKKINAVRKRLALDGFE